MVLSNYLLQKLWLDLTTSESRARDDWITTKTTYAAMIRHRGYNPPPFTDKQSITKAIKAAVAWQLHHHQQQRQPTITRRLVDRRSSEGNNCMKNRQQKERLQTEPHNNPSKPLLQSLFLMPWSSLIVIVDRQTNKSHRSITGWHGNFFLWRKR